MTLAATAGEMMVQLASEGVAELIASGVAMGVGGMLVGPVGAVGGWVAGKVAGHAIERLAQAILHRWSPWLSSQPKDSQASAIEQLATVPVKKAREIADSALRQVAPQATPEQRSLAVEYIVAIPQMTRRSLRRPSDPTGITVPAGFSLDKPADLLQFLPTKLPRFKSGERPLRGVDREIIELLGVGGFGEVWKARNPYQSSDPPVALKFCLNAEASRALKNEADLLDRIKRQGSYSGIVRLLQTYLDADPPCLEYEFVDGGDLAGLIQEWHRVKKNVPPLAGSVMRRLAEIVGFFHRLDPPIVHRDLKPANIFVQKKNNKLFLKVGDFGIGGIAVSEAIARTRGNSTGALMEATVARGSYTPLYASPQQMAGKQADCRDDVYALGVIWYQLLTGDLTRGRPGGSRWMERLTEQGMPPTMAKLLESCIEDDPDDRPADAAVLAKRLTELLIQPAKPEAASAPDARAVAAVQTSKRSEEEHAGNRSKRTYKYEAMDISGREIKDSVEALSEEEALQKIRQMGYFVTKITASASSASSEVPLETQKEQVTQQAPLSDDKNEFVLSLDKIPLGDEPPFELAEPQRKQPASSKKREMLPFESLVGNIVYTAFMAPVAGAGASALFRLMAWLPAWFFGWEVGSWFTWLVWGTPILGIWYVLLAWFIIDDSRTESTHNGVQEAGSNSEIVLSPGESLSESGFDLTLDTDQSHP